MDWKSTTAGVVLLLAVVAGCVSNLTPEDRQAIGQFAVQTAPQVDTMEAEADALRTQAAAADVAAAEATAAGDLALAKAKQDEAKRLRDAAKTLDGTASTLAAGVAAAQLLSDPNLTDEDLAGTALTQVGAMLPPPYNVLVPSGGLVLLAGFKAWQERRRLKTVVQAIQKAGGVNGPQALSLSKALGTGDKALVNRWTHGVEASPALIAGGTALAEAEAGVARATTAGQPGPG